MAATSSASFSADLEIVARGSPHRSGFRTRRRSACARSLRRRRRCVTPGNSCRSLGRSFSIRASEDKVPLSRVHQPGPDPSHMRARCSETRSPRPSRWDAEIDLDRRGLLADGLPDDLFHPGGHPRRFLQACAHGQLDDEAELALIHGGKEFAADEEIKRKAAQKARPPPRTTVLRWARAQARMD